MRGQASHTRVLATVENDGQRVVRSDSAELQALVDEHGSIDRAARMTGQPRDDFRAKCRSLGVRATRGELLPDVGGRGE